MLFRFAKCAKTYMYVHYTYIFYSSSQFLFLYKQLVFKTYPAIIICKRLEAFLNE